MLGWGLGALCSVCPWTCSPKCVAGRSWQPVTPGEPSTRGWLVNGESQASQETIWIEALCFGLLARSAATAAPLCLQKEQPAPVLLTRALVLSRHSKQQLRSISQHFWGAGCVPGLVLGARDMTTKDKEGSCSNAGWA